MQELAERVAAEVRELVRQEDEVWAVTHSMGGIILRHIQALPDRGALDAGPPNLWHHSLPPVRRAVVQRGVPASAIHQMRV